MAVPARALQLPSASRGPQPRLWRPLQLKPRPAATARWRAAPRAPEHGLGCRSVPLLPTPESEAHLANRAGAEPASAVQRRPAAPPASSLLPWGVGRWGGRSPGRSCAVLAWVNLPSLLHPPVPRHMSLLQARARSTASPLAQGCLHGSPAGRLQAPTRLCGDCEDAFLRGPPTNTTSSPSQRERGDPWRFLTGLV